MNRSTHNREKTIESIKESFITLYEQMGIEKISVQTVCQKSGVSRSIFYRYFDDKYQVLEEIEEEMLDAMRTINRKIPQTPLIPQKGEKIYPLFYETANYIRDHAEYIRPLLGIHGDPLFVQKWKRAIEKDAIEKFRLEKLNLYDDEIVATMFSSALLGLYRHWLVKKPELSAVEISEISGHLLSGTAAQFRYSKNEN